MTLCFAFGISGLSGLDNYVSIFLRKVWPHQWVLAVVVKAGCLIGGSHRRDRLNHCYLQYTHSPRDLRRF